MKAYDISRDEAKEKVLRVMFNGTVKEKFLDDFAKEIKKATKEFSVLEEYTALAESLKKSEKNFYGSLLSYITQTEERKIMLSMRDFLLADGWSPDILAFDGIMIRKRSDKTADAAFLTEMANHIKRSTGYEVKVIEKPIIGYDLPSSDTKGPHPEVSLEKYEIMKMDFESRAGYHSETEKFYYIKDDGRILFLSVSSASHFFYPLYNFKSAHGTRFESIPFLPLWLKDDKRTNTYRFTMDESEAGEGVCVVPYKPNWTVCETVENEEVIKVWNEFLEMLMPAEIIRNTFVQWLAQLIQHPFKNSLCCSVLVGPKGCGKDTLEDFIQDYLIGRDYATNYTSTEAFWDKHDCGRLNRVFAKLEEACGAINKQNEAGLKARITASLERFNEKGVKAFTAPNYCRLFITSNEGNPVPLEEKERRFLPIVTGKQIGRAHV